MVSDDFIIALRRIMAAVCCIFGLPGNILTIIVCIKALSRRTINFERKVFDLYLAEISILDTCLLLYWVVDIGLKWLYSNEYFSLAHTSAFSCYFFYMANRLFSALCSWLITCFTLIRFINIFRRFNTIRSNIILLTCLTVIFSLANSYLIVTIDYYEPSNSQFVGNGTQNASDSVNNSTVCILRDEYENDPVKLLLNTLVAGFLSLAIPSMLTFIVNVAIVCYIRRIYKIQNPESAQRRLESPAPNYRSSRSTLLVISITYTVCYLPYCIIYLFRIIFPHLDTPLSHWAAIASFLRYISHSVNFYAYIFTNHRFRRDIILLFRSVIRPCAYIKKRKQVRKKVKRENQFVYRHYRLPQSAQSSNSGKMVCVYQRAAGARFQHPNNFGYQQNLQTNEAMYNKQTTILATVSPTCSTEKCRNRVRI